MLISNLIMFVMFNTSNLVDKIKGFRTVYFIFIFIACYFVHQSDYSSLLPFYFQEFVSADLDYQLYIFSCRTIDYMFFPVLS